MHELHFGSLIFCNPDKKFRIIYNFNPIENIDSGFRYARVLKTVAYIVVDEDEYGDAIVEKWNIKKQRIYERRLS